MIYRNRNALYFPLENGAYQRESCKSINAAKRRVREEKLVVRRGLPPAQAGVPQG